MSDGFDKEAEREKLREKFERDKEKREHTQRMSELLLQGATMTNRHCEECGDPIFRHDGREFCPTCQAERSQGNAGAAAGNARGAADTHGETSPDEAPPTDDATPSATQTDESAATAANGSAPASRDEAATTAGSSPRADATSTDQPQTERSPAEPATTETGAAEATTAETPAAGSPSPDTERVAGGDDRSAARASLTRTLTRFARAAEQTDDPRRARDHLEAAREAAEALAALE
ncbi:hypothetical protein GJ633_09830 [Halorubrum sp. CBA1125]|uniref:Sjogren's syndrome/scleroderma autoantigen 1 family protein n=1 Tax=Halorubrum sp. CBA1125 TaxID=2668072 RepID=UPI0012E933DE|nr:Sjogren's syndrome/scleroderma autoantigen 1 family protein [Halorubrum sp. CBA1125]MUW14931.1 hypothetical protein [Halorubrum sp. CBA1125]